LNPKGSKAAKELEDLIARAEDLPGVAEVMKMYNTYHKVLVEARPYTLRPEAPSTASDSSS
jgi:hypothetical protein